MKIPNQELTEDLWNTSSSLEHQPYSFSKTVAEKEAWEINKAQDRWELVTINPSFVLGPGINPFGTSESFAIMKQIEYVGEMQLDWLYLGYWIEGCQKMNYKMFPF